MYLPNSESIHTPLLQQNLPGISWYTCKLILFKSPSPSLQFWSSNIFHFCKPKGNWFLLNRVVSVCAPKTLYYVLELIINILNTERIIAKVIYLPSSWGFRPSHFTPDVPKKYIFWLQNIISINIAILTDSWDKRYEPYLVNLNPDLENERQCLFEFDKWDISSYCMIYHSLHCWVPWIPGSVLAHSSYLVHLLKDK